MEVKFEFKGEFFVVAVFLWPNRVVIGINMHQEPTRLPKWPLGLGGGWGQGRKKIFRRSLIFYGFLFLFKHLLEL
jgi:hypothetical protein